MSNDTISLIQAVVRDQLRSFKTMELGVVTKLYSHESASDKNNYECDVRLRDSGLELKRVPVSTQRIGAVAIPNKDDLVLVQYLNGDIHSAVVAGRVYNDQDRPPEAKPHEFVYVSPDDPESGIRRAYLEFPKDNKLRLDDDKFVFEMGKTKVTIKHDGEVEVKSNDQNITLTDRNGNNMIKIKAQPGQINVQAQMKVVVEAPQIELVENATHPLVFGDQLLQYLNQLVQLYQTHVHPGEMALGVFPVTPAPPVPPFLPATPALLSTKVKTG
jgi:phage baseplate assembly protein gpV